MKRITVIVFILSNYFITTSAQLPSAVNKFTDSEINNLHEKNGKRWLQLIDELTIEAGLYKLKAGDKDPQPVHEYDEIYYVEEGEVKLLAGDSTLKHQPGHCFM